MAELSRYDVCITSYEPRLAVSGKDNAYRHIQDMQHADWLHYHARESKRGKSIYDIPLFTVNSLYVQTSQLSLMIGAKNDFCP